MRLAALTIVVLFAFTSRPAPANGREMSYGRVVRAIDNELAKPQWRAVLEVSLHAIRRGTPVADALEHFHYVERAAGAYRYTPRALAGSGECDVPDPACRLFPFGTNARAGLPLRATLFSPKTSFNEAVWTYWFSYFVKPSTPFALRAAREGLVDTISADGTQCPAVWSPARPLLANASVGPDLPFQIEIKSHLFLHGAIRAPKAKGDLVCDFAALELEIRQTR